jgi:hypothetical protein
VRRGHVPFSILSWLRIKDRNNVPTARLRGFEKDLGLHGTQYQTVLSILYVGQSPRFSSSCLRVPLAARSDVEM